jgi:hypothetical protein
MSSSTQRALAQRAIGAANLMEAFQRKLAQEMEQQNINWDAPNTVTLSLPVPMILDMCTKMVVLKKEIRQLEKNLENRGKFYGG